jgi:glycine dehydrogenase subunit 2
VRRAAPPRLPEVSELQAVRHFSRLAQDNYSIDTGFYPLGSCTMKYNPKLNDRMAALSGFADLHPFAPDAGCQGALRLLWELEAALCEIAGMAAFTLQPAAGAHGELTGMLMTRAWHESRGEGGRRTRVITPDSAHGTNPATAAMAGYEVVEVPSDARGGVDVAALEGLLDDRVAALMLTNPNTLGLWDEHLARIAELVHGAGGLLYYDGANANAILGRARPGDMGFDIVHLNLHKTFSTPHGMGGPGAGPVGVAAPLVPLLPSPRVERVVRAGPAPPEQRTGGMAGGGWPGGPHGGTGPGPDPADYSGGSAVAAGAGPADAVFRWRHDLPRSIGRVRAHHGNFGVLVRTYAYILALGADGLAAVSGHAVLNANYLLARLRDVLDVPHDRRCMHEFVLSAAGLRRRTGVRAHDLAKRLLDHGFHPPTVYFPLSVEEALMVEPTETESRESLDAFADAVVAVVEEASSSPEAVRTAPHTTPVGRLDEVEASRHPVLRWMPPSESPSGRA